MPTQAPAPQVGAGLVVVTPHLGSKLLDLPKPQHLRPLSPPEVLRPKSCEELKHLSALVLCRWEGGDRIASRR